MACFLRGEGSRALLVSNRVDMMELAAQNYTVSCRPARATRPGHAVLAWAKASYSSHVSVRLLLETSI